MRHPDILRDLVALISKQPNLRKGIIVPEFEVFRGKSRIDLALIGARLVGFEIKSRHDSLRRLQSQLSFYLPIFDYIYIVADQKHVKNIVDATPMEVGIVTLTDVRAPMHFTRQAKINPDVQYEALLSLLWKPELLNIGKSLGLGSELARSNRQQLIRSISTKFSLDSVRTLILKNLVSRQYDRLSA